MHIGKHIHFTVVVFTHIVMYDVMHDISFACRFECVATPLSVVEVTNVKHHEQTNVFAKRVVDTNGDTESEPEPPEPFVWDEGDESLDNSLDNSFGLMFQDPFAGDMQPPAEPRGPGARSRESILERLGASSHAIAASKPKPQPMNVDVEIVDLADWDGEDELRDELANPAVVNQEGDDQLPNEAANLAVKGG